MWNTMLAKGGVCERERYATSFLLDLQGIYICMRGVPFGFSSYETRSFVLTGNQKYLAWEYTKGGWVMRKKKKGNQTAIKMMK